MQTHRRMLGILLVALFVSGCNLPVPPSDGAKTNQVQPKEKIEFDWRTWKPHGPVWEFSDVPRRKTMEAYVYKLSDSTNEYLLDCTNINDATYERILAVQRKSDGMMLRDGPCKHWLQNGEVIESTYRLSFIYGNRKVYFKNGNLKFDLIYFEDKLTGKAYGYNEDGSLKWEATYKDDILIGTPSIYKEDGSLDSEASFNPMLPTLDDF